MATSYPHPFCQNRLLDSLPEDEFQYVLPHLQEVDLTFKQLAYDRNQPIEYIYFPCNCVVSMLNLADGHLAVEVATVGREGMVGIPVFLGMDQINGVAISQIPGEAVRMPTAAFKQAVKGDTVLRRSTQLFILALFTMVAQSSACNRLHSIEQRFARWMLMAHDRVGSDEFELTHEFIAQMLGVSRPSVSIVATAYQQAGIIQYSRGKITILDRKGLEAASCQCYQVIRDAFDQALGPGAEKSGMS